MDHVVLDRVVKVGDLRRVVPLPLFVPQIFGNFRPALVHHLPHLAAVEQREIRVIGRYARIGPVRRFAANRRAGRGCFPLLAAVIAVAVYLHPRVVARGQRNPPARCRRRGAALSISAALLHLQRRVRSTTLPPQASVLLLEGTLLVSSLTHLIRQTSHERHESRKLFCGMNVGSTAHLAQLAHHLRAEEVHHASLRSLVANRRILVFELWRSIPPRRCWSVEGRALECPLRCEAVCAVRAAAATRAGEAAARGKRSRAWRARVRVEGANSAWARVARARAPLLLIAVAAARRL